MDSARLRIERKYGAGENLRLAARAVERQVRKRFEDFPRRPRKVIVLTSAAQMESRVALYGQWYEQVLALYEKVTQDDVTKAEVAADMRLHEAFANAYTAIRELKRLEKWELLKRLEIDPYGHCTWTIGTEDDFICLDYGIEDDGTFVFRSVVNSEPVSFIEEFEYEDQVEPTSAVRIAIGMVDSAYRWCWEAGDFSIEVDEDGGNYAGWRFVEEIKRAVGDTTTVNPFPRKPEKGTEDA